MTAYLRILSDTNRRLEFPLNRMVENIIGRGRESQIQIDDPRASRSHARVIFKEGDWTVVDLASRNGTYVNGSKIDSALLIDGTKICIGDTELVFSNSGVQESVTREQISAEIPLVSEKPDSFLDPKSKEFGLKAFEALRGPGLEKQLSALHEFALKSNSASTEKDLVDQAMDVLSDCTQADSVAFLLSNEFGSLDLAGQRSTNPSYRPEISDQLNDMVNRKRRAVWLQQETEVLGKKAKFADAICVPLLDNEESIGALHVYSQKRKFERCDFDFSIAVASVVGLALARVLSAESIQAELGRLQVKNADFDELIGRSKVMGDLKDRVRRVAKASGCILIRGESGAGKELVAKAIHRNSHRAARPMLSVNCAAIPDELMESQLFGHVKGAFTGADREHVGYFQQANKGTLFLDEVGELNLEGQAKLLRILEGHPFLPVGATQEIRVDVRVISATNRDLREFVAEKRFREDLYYRLSVFEIYIPPLRERGSDIDLLIEFFLNHFKKQNGRKNLGISPSAMDMLRSYSWPGNVRQLRNVIDSAVVLADGLEIVPRDLSLRDVGSADLLRKLRFDAAILSDALKSNPNEDPLLSTVIIRKDSLPVDKNQEQIANSRNDDADSSNWNFDTLKVEVWEQRLINEAMRRTNGNIPAAAELMGIARATLYRKLEKGPNPQAQEPPPPSQS